MYDHMHERCVNSSEKNNTMNLLNEKNENVVNDINNSNKEKIDDNETTNELNHENNGEINNNHNNNDDNNENDDYDNKIKNKRSSGILIESHRNRKTDLSNKILPDAFHNICHEFRRAGDFKAMVDFIAKYGPIASNFNFPFK